MNPEKQKKVDHVSQRWIWERNQEQDGTRILAQAVRLHYHTERTQTRERLYTQLIRYIGYRSLIPYPETVEEVPAYDEAIAQRGKEIVEHWQGGW